MPRPLALAAALLLASSLLAFGCGKQGEGERCDINNNNADCAGDLICKSSEDLNRSSDVCCPETGSVEPACIPNVGTGGGGGAGGGSSSGGSGNEGGGTAGR